MVSNIMCFWKLQRIIIIILFLKLLLMVVRVQDPFELELLEYHSFQNIIVCRTIHNKPALPSTIQDIQLVVKYAILRNLSVKAIGRLHSATDLICTDADGILMIMHNINHIRYDHASKRVTVGGGTTLKELTEHLHHLHGRALVGLPAFGGITVAGALATGAHGSSLIHPSTLSDQMTRVTFVDGQGGIVNTSDPQLLSAFKTHLGLLGVLYEVTLDTVAQFKITFNNYEMPEWILTRDSHSHSQLEELARSRDYFHFWWFPAIQRVVISEGTVVVTGYPVEGDECQTNLIPDLSREMSLFTRSLLASGNAVALFILELFSMRYSNNQKVPGFTPLHSSSTSNGRGCHNNNNNTGYSHKMLSNTCEKCAWDYGPDASLELKEFSIVIPAKEVESAVSMMKRLLRSHPAHFPLNGVLFRFIKSSNGLMSVNRDRDSVAIEWVALNPPEKYGHAAIAGITSRQAIQQALVREYQGRAHWGKNGLYFTSPEMIHLQHDGQHQHRHRFVKYMKLLDPHGVFLNPFGRRVAAFKTPDYNILDFPRVIKRHCALHDNCLCKSDSDCGDDDDAHLALNLKCGMVDNNYTVCLEEEQTKSPLRIYWNRLVSSGSGPLRQLVQLLMG